MMMPGRKYSASSSSYRYGFNGKENDSEVKGEGNQQDYGMRIHDPRLGRFLSVDPIGKEFPELTTYQFASNSPVANIDLDGGEKLYYTLAIKDGKPELSLTNHVDTYKTSDGKEAKFPLSYEITYNKNVFSFAISSLAGGKYGNAPDNTTDKFDAWYFAITKDEKVSEFSETFYSDDESAVMLLDEAVTEWALGMAVPRDRGTIYEVPGTATGSGKPYVGRHNKPNPTVTRTSNDGRDRTKAIVKDTYDETDESQGKYKEQKRIDVNGGKSNLDNRRNEVNPLKMAELEKKYGQGKWKIIVPKTKTEKAEEKEKQRKIDAQKVDDMIKYHG
jgi:RHS repeat-associated protein